TGGARAIIQGGLRRGRDQRGLHCCGGGGCYVGRVRVGEAALRGASAVRAAGAWLGRHWSRRGSVRPPPRPRGVWRKTLVAELVILQGIEEAPACPPPPARAAAPPSCRLHNWAAAAPLSGVFGSPKTGRKHDHFSPDLAVARHGSLGVWALTEAPGPKAACGRVSGEQLGKTGSSAFFVSCRPATQAVSDGTVKPKQ
ncbi:unnamed protein product, partial [Phaeothamnion confervicola]